MAITRDEVLHVARLARLELTEEEVDALRASSSSAILEAVGEGRPSSTWRTSTPTSHPLDLVERVGRGRAAARRCRVEDALANAPDREDDVFRVPAALTLRAVSVQMSTSVTLRVTDACAFRGGYGVCRGPGGPLGRRPRRTRA